MTDQPLFPRSHFRKDLDYAELWEKFKQGDAERYADRGKGYQSLPMERIEKYEEQQLLKHEQ